MEINEIYQRLNRIFRDVFRDPSLTVGPYTVIRDIEDWDSLEHFSLIAAIERAFRLKFRAGEISSMKTVGDIAAILQARCKL